MDQTAAQGLDKVTDHVVDETTAELSSTSVALKQVRVHKAL